MAGGTTSLSIRSGGTVGDADNANLTPDPNANALDLNVDTLAVAADSGIYLRELAAGGALTVDTAAAVSVDVESVVEVHFNSTTSDASQDDSLAALEDLSTSNNGPIKVVAEAGSLTLNAGTGGGGLSADGTGDVLLAARGTSSDITLNAAVASGSGHVKLSAADDVHVDGSLTTGGTGSVFVWSGNGTTDEAG